MVYSTVAEGRLYGPVKTDTDDPDTDRLITLANQMEFAEPLQSSNDSNVEVEELYFRDGMLHLTIPFGDFHISLKVPLRASDDFAKELSKMNKAFDSMVQDSGYFVSHDDLEFARTFSTDSQGRVTLGSEYANQDIQLVGTDD